MDTKGIIILAAVGGAVYYGNKLLRTANIGDKLNIRYFNTRLHSINEKGIEIRTDVLLQNPTKEKLNLTQPFVRLLKDGKVLGSSNMESKQINVDKLSQTTIKDLSVSTSYTELGSSIWIQLWSLVKGKSIKDAVNDLNLSIEYSTYANGIPYSKLTPVTV